MCAIVVSVPAKPSDYEEQIKNRCVVLCVCGAHDLLVVTITSINSLDNHHHHTITSTSHHHLHPLRTQPVLEACPIWHADVIAALLPHAADHGAVLRTGRRTSPSLAPLPSTPTPLPSPIPTLSPSPPIPPPSLHAPSHTLFIPSLSQSPSHTLFIPSLSQSSPCNHHARLQLGPKMIQLMVNGRFKHWTDDTIDMDAFRAALADYMFVPRTYPRNHACSHASPNPNMRRRYHSQAGKGSSEFALGHVFETPTYAYDPLHR